MMSLLLILPVFFGLLGLNLLSITNHVYSVTNRCNGNQCEQPIIYDPTLKVEMIFQTNFKFERNSLSPVSSMTFVGPDEILLLDKNNGVVYRVLNNSLIADPILDVSVANERERGLLGIEVTKNINNLTYVYLYYTESEKNDGNDVCPTKWYSDAFHCIPEYEPLGNRFYKYELKDNKLINPKLLLDLPAAPSPTHNGGVVKIGPDNNLYVTIGDLLGSTSFNSSTKAQNLNGTDPDGRSGILRITKDDTPVGSGIIGSSYPVNLYYAYGMRNSFGIDFDPVTGNLWDTENGPEYGDEVNLVKPGFNSGWEIIQGIWEPIVNTQSNESDLIAGKELLNPGNRLIDFQGSGIYSKPEFIWKFIVGPTAIKFLDSHRLGIKYENDLFIGSVSGRIFHFDLTEDRTSLRLSGLLKDDIADTMDELKDITFVEGLGLVTDIDVGPDGYLYVLCDYKDKVTIFRIRPNID